jgi:hypothetical protein
MNRLAAALLALASLAPGYAFAWCDNPDEGRSQRFFVAMYTVSACNPNKQFAEGTEVIEFTPIKRNGESVGATQAVRLSDECKRTGDGKGLSCSKSGRTPLAGATYITTHDMKDVCDETGKTLVDRLTCVKGCQAGRTPKHIEGSPWEC